jgi:hypothetical protein
MVQSQEQNTADREGANGRRSRGIRALGLAAAIAFGLFGATAGPADAFLMDGTTNVGDTFTVNFKLLPGQVDNGGNVLGGTNPLTASIVYTVDLIDLSATGEVQFTIDISNTTTTVLNENILAIGFFTNPEVAINSFTGGSTFLSAAEDTNFPSFQEIDICIFAQNCTGGAFSAGLAPGASDQIMISLVGDLSVGSLRIFPSVIKFQGDLGSFEFSQIPEPSSLLLFFSGLLGLGYFSRRRLAS